MNYKQIEEYVLNIPKFRAEGSIEQTRKFYEFLGKPGKSASIIHVAGTNGKGSTCAYMNSVLIGARYKVGMFTSPHLVSVRERVRVNNTLISEWKFVAIFQELIKQIGSYNESMKKDFLQRRGGFEEQTGSDNVSTKKALCQRTDSAICENITEKIVRSLEKTSTESTYCPTFYEFLFFMAMLYFEKQKTDIIILETGLGGRLDATNVIDAPKVAVITEIGKDHMEYLGDTFEKIAEEKAGIIKKGSHVVYSGNRQETAAVIERKAKELGVLCKCVEKTEKQGYRFVDKKIDFSFFSRYYGYIPIKLNTCAIYQMENARVALTAIEELGLEIPKEIMQVGMEKCKWEGRMEEVLPGVYLDGAHNEDGIDAFIATVKQKDCNGKRWLLFSAVADKEYKIMKEKLTESGLFDYIYASPLKNTRTISKRDITDIFEHKKVRVADSAYEGLQEIVSLKNEEDLVYVTGSLYLVGEIKEHLF